MTPSSPDKTPPHQRKSSSGLLILLVIIAVAAAAAGIIMRMHQESSLNNETKDAAVADVVVMKAPNGPAVEDIVLPGNMQAWHEAPIYARTNGYLKDWVTDIGAQVKTGDLLATIEAPEVDAQMHQAEADLVTAQANSKIAQTTAERWENLLKTKAVSKQDADDRAAAAAAAAANETAAEANVNHLKELVGFEHIVAPFDGIITARNTDDGQLINAGSSTGVGPQLFHIAETDKLRVFVEVPETYADAVKPDLAVDLQLVEHPGKSFPAKLVHSADAIDPTTRTLLIELEVDNDKGELLPGSYVQTHLKLPAQSQAVILPVNTFLFRAQGMQVATIDDDGKAVLKSVTIGRDYGKKIEVTSGVAPGETIIVNPPDSLANGQPVRVITQGKNGGGDGKDSKDNKDNKGDGKKSGDDKSGDGK